jgi:hypothetical protein
MKFVRPTRLLVGGVAALGMMVAVAHPPRVFAGPGDHVIAVPEVPRNLEVQSGNTVYLEGHAVGTQNYICMACPNAITPAARCPASGFAWAFLGPQATLFDAHDERQVITHYNSPNPGEGGRERPTWQHSRDTSAVWGNNTVPPAESSTDPAFVRQDAIPWLLLPVASTEPGPKGPGTLTETTFIQRLDTEGGLAPDASTCAAPSDAGKKALVPYSADYFFYKKAH